MPFYSLNSTERELHLRNHNLNLPITVEKYCSLCYPVPYTYRIDITTQNPRFYNFWYWISHKYTARRYNQYTLNTFENIEESLQRGDLRICEDLIQSIEFKTFKVSEAALTFYTARLFVDTNKFEIDPTEAQDQHAQFLFTIPNLDLGQLKQQLSTSMTNNNTMNANQLQQLIAGLQGTNQNITTSLENMFGAQGHFTAAINNLNAPAAPAARELSLVKVEPFRGQEMKIHTNGLNSLIMLP